MKFNTCEVCQEQPHKYRCPKCNKKYCSLSCYKTHRESCVSSTGEQSHTHSGQGATSASITAAATVDSTTATFDNNSTANEGTIEEDKAEDEEDAQDKVLPEKLHLLGSSAALRVQLENDHLRELIQGLDSHHAPGQHLVSLMQEPLFTEFVDECLKVVEPHSDHNLPQINSDDG